MMRIVSGLALVLAAFTLPSIAVADGVLDRIAKEGEIRLAYRADAAPFSFMGEGDAEPQGYSLELCRAVAESVKAELKLADLKITYVKVTSDDRFEAITGGKADLLCEATTATLGRRASMDFSIATFISGAGMMIQPGGPTSFEALAGMKVGVLSGTTTEEDLKAFLAARSVAAEIVTVQDHSEGFAQLESGALAAYFADRTILQFMLMKHNQNGKLLLADQFLSFEPYALALPRDEDFRLEVDRALSRMFRNGGGRAAFAKVFGGDAKATGLQSSLFVISGLPE
ncbi:amino acid ABC transporter substrate-binding protein [Dongia sp.]|uniref:amino acid ABC transporter substrate-binding protein n=1 Tax=Dongia sp. TaxID=1977262 RepID=UPI003752D477